jgi:hypothetical protein
MNTQFYSTSQGIPLARTIWTKTVGLLALIMILAPFKAQAQNQTFVPQPLFQIWQIQDLQALLDNGLLMLQAEPH